MFGNKETTIEIIGSRQGEKKDELLISKNEIPFTEETDEFYFTIYPPFLDHKAKPNMSIKEFTSRNTKQLTVKELESILKKEEWLID